VCPASVGILILYINIAYLWNKTRKISGNIMKMFLLPRAINIFVVGYPPSPLVRERGVNK
jgi:ABC-type sugar transport system permease subunit